jgi:hypothetical protein
MPSAKGNDECRKTGGTAMHKISLIVLLAATVLTSGCYTKAYVQQMLKAQQAQSLQSNASPAAGQANK